MNRKRTVALLMCAFYLLQLIVIVYWYSLAPIETRSTDALVGIAIAVGAGIVDFSIARYLLSALNRLEASYGYDVAKQLERSLAGYREESLHEEKLAKELGASIASELGKAHEALTQGDSTKVSDLMRASLDIASSASAPACENVTVAAVLASKSRQCGKEDVVLRPQIVLPEPLPLPDIDIAAIFFNLIDNALHECKSLMEEGLVADPQIDVSSRIQAGQLFVKVENPSHQGVDTKRERTKRRASTSWEHGWGTEIVSSIAQEQGGIAEFDESGGRFVATVMIPLVQGETSEEHLSSDDHNPAKSQTLTAQEPSQKSR